MREAAKLLQDRAEILHGRVKVSHRRAEVLQGRVKIPPTREKPSRGRIKALHKAVKVLPGRAKFSPDCVVLFRAKQFTGLSEYENSDILINRSEFKL